MTILNKSEQEAGRKMRERGLCVVKRDESFSLPRDEKHFKKACRIDTNFCMEWDCQRWYCIETTGNDCEWKAGSENCIFRGEFHVE